MIKTPCYCSSLSATVYAETAPKCDFCTGIRKWTNEELDALGDLGPDVADGSITSDEAVQIVLRAREG